MPDAKAAVAPMTGAMEGRDELRRLVRDHCTGKGRGDQARGRTLSVRRKPTFSYAPHGGRSIVSVVWRPPVRRLARLCGAARQDEKMARPLLRTTGPGVFQAMRGRPRPDVAHAGGTRRFPSAIADRRRDRRTAVWQFVDGWHPPWRRPQRAVQAPIWHGVASCRPRVLETSRFRQASPAVPVGPRNLAIP